MAIVTIFIRDDNYKMIDKFQTKNKKQNESIQDALNHLNEKITGDKINE